MKAFTIVILLILPLRLLADGGNCVKYKVKINLKTNKSVIGYLLVGSYEPRTDFKEISFIDYLNSLHLDTINLYTVIKELVYPVTNHSYNCEYHYDAIPENAVIKISPKDIESADLLGYYPCNKCDKEFYYCGFNPIFELNEKEIELLQTKPIADSSFSYNSELHPSSIWIVSYNRDYDIDKIKQIWFEYFNQVKSYVEGESLVKEENWKFVNNKYMDLKNMLQKTDVIVFEVYYSL